MHNVDNILQEAEKAIQDASDLSALNAVKVKFLGKKGELTQSLKSLGSLPADERPQAGQKINHAKVQIQKALEIKEDALQNSVMAQQLADEAIDVTLPGRRHVFGRIHPITQTFEALRDIFGAMGFSFEEGPEVEDDFHNFAALNIPALHPARAMQDTFYFPDNKLLRTHMSPVQIRTLKQTEPPLRMVAMGRVYRHDFDLTHTPMFHQMEGLMIDQQTSFADLKGILKHFVNRYFERDVGMRFRTSYFPFTEPSAEVDITCLTCSGNGCRICKQTGWLEVLGCGMVHPNVLKAVDIDADVYQGFAFGVGVDRLAMLKYGITDLRAFFENDLRFLKQF